MAKITLQDIQFRRGTESFYTNSNPLLAIGEPAFEIDTYKFKIGNGVDRWNQLPYVTGNGSGGGVVTSVNGNIGAVVLDADDIDSSSTVNKFITASGLNKLNFITVTSPINLNTLENTANSALQSYIETDPIFTASAAANIVTGDITKLSNLSGINTGDETGSSIINKLDTELANTRWKVVEVPSGGATGQVLKKLSNANYDYAWSTDNIGTSGGVNSVNSQTGIVVLDADDISDTSTVNKFVTAADIVKLNNLSGSNTGDQDISGIIANATAISSLNSSQSIQDAAIALNTAKISYPGPQDADEVPVNPAVNGNTNVQAVLADHESRIVGLTAGGSDGVVTNVALSGTNLNFTGSGGGFNGTIDLSSLGGGSSSSLATDDQTLTALRRINLGESSPNSLFIYPTESDTGTDYLYSFGTTGAVFNRSLQILNNNNISMGSGKITGVGNPTDNNDAANKVYVDNAVAGITNTQDGSDIVLTGYIKGSDNSAVAATDTANEAFAKLENQIEDAIISGGGLTTDQANRLANVNNVVRVSLNGSGAYTTTIANQEVQSGSDIGSKVINTISDTSSRTIALTNTSTTKINKYSFDLLNAGGQINFTSVNGFVADGFTGNAVRLDGIGSVDFVETGPNTGIFYVIPGNNVSYVTLDLTAPTISSAVVENATPTSLVMTYNEALDTGSVPATGAFAVNDGASNPVTNVAVSGTTVTLTLTNAIENGDTVILSYTPGANPIQDVAGNDAASLSGYSVTNNVAPAGPTNLHTQANAANPDNEANATTGWTLFGANTVLESVADATGNGIFAIRGSTNAATTDAGIRYSFTAVSGRTYRVTWQDRSTNTTGGPRAVLWSGVTTSPSIAINTPTYTSRSVDVTANATTITLNFQLSTFGTSTVNGTNLYVDNLVITDITP